MRQRIVKKNLVASTNSDLNDKINELTNRCLNLDKAIFIGERVGRKAHAILECSKSNKASIENIGTFECITNSNRVDVKLLTKMCNKIK